MLLYRSVSHSLPVLLAVPYVRVCLFVPLTHSFFLSRFLLLKRSNGSHSVCNANPRAPNQKTHKRTVYALLSLAMSLSTRTTWDGGYDVIIYIARTKTNAKLMVRTRYEWLWVQTRNAQKKNYVHTHAYRNAHIQHTQLRGIHKTLAKWLFHVSMQLNNSWKKENAIMDLHVLMWCLNEKWPLFLLCLRAVVITVVVVDTFCARLTNESGLRCWSHTWLHGSM